MVATDTTISGSAGSHELGQLAPGRLGERDAHVDADEQRDGQLVGEGDERQLHGLAPDLRGIGVRCRDGHGSHIGTSSPGRAGEGGRRLDDRAGTGASLHVWAGSRAD